MDLIPYHEKTHDRLLFYKNRQPATCIGEKTINPINKNKLLTDVTQKIKRTVIPTRF
jgi:hypothetical protein